MTLKSLLTRRQCIGGISLAGIFPFLRLKQDLFQSNNKDDYLKFLIEALKEQALFIACGFPKGQIPAEIPNGQIDPEFKRGHYDNLRYAYEQINPQNHHEVAFIVACGSHAKPLAHIVDEYVRRRKGEKSLLPDVEMAPPIVTGQPDTQRVLIFKEQLMSLLDELTCLDESYNQMIFDRILKKEETYDTFIAESLVPIYRELIDEELIDRDWLKPAYDAILYYGPICRSYVWCSTVANYAREMMVKAR